MFTGLVESIGTVTKISPQGPGVTLAIDSEVLADAEIGASISINGCCLTVVELDGHVASFEAGEETLNRTNLGDLEISSSVNLERSLRCGDRMGGHFVTGHIDCVGTIRSRDDDGEWSTIWFNIPAPFHQHLASKGSIAVDGISLTLVDVNVDNTKGFSVALIPHTLEHTTLGSKKVGDRINLETDILAKYIEQAVSHLPTR